MNNRRLWLIIALIIFIISVVLFWILPTIASLTDTRTKIIDAIISREQAKQQQNDIVQLKQQYEKIKQDAHELGAAFLAKSSDSLIQTIDSLETTCEKHRLAHAINISPLPQGADDPIDKSDITLTLSGTLDNILAFLREVENAPAYYNFTSLQLSYQNNAATPISILIKGTIYWQ